MDSSKAAQASSKSCSMVGGSLFGVFIKRCSLAFRAAAFYHTSLLEKRFCRYLCAVTDFASALKPTLPMPAKCPKSDVINEVVVPEQVSRVTGGRFSNSAALQDIFENLHRHVENATIDALHNYFDKALSISMQLDGMDPSSISNPAAMDEGLVLPRAILLMATAHSLFGHHQEAARAVKEAIHLAQGRSDDACLMYALTWMAQAEVLRQRRDRRLQLLQVLPYDASASIRADEIAGVLSRCVARSRALQTFGSACLAQNTLMRSHLHRACITSTAMGRDTISSNGCRVPSRSVHSVLRPSLRLSTFMRSPSDVRQTISMLQSSLWSRFGHPDLSVTHAIKSPVKAVATGSSAGNLPRLVVAMDLARRGRLEKSLELLRKTTRDETLSIEDHLAVQHLMDAIEASSTNARSVSKLL